MLRESIKKKKRLRSEEDTEGLGIALGHAPWKWKSQFQSWEVGFRINILCRLCCHSCFVFVVNLIFFCIFYVWMNFQRSKLVYNLSNHLSSNTIVVVYDENWCWNRSFWNSTKFLIIKVKCSLYSTYEQNKLYVFKNIYCKN